YNGLKFAPGTYPLADPLVVLEQRTPDRPLPPALTIAAERDFLIDDSRRLKQAMDRLGSTCALHVYPGEHHVFHALPWSKHTVRCWKDQRTFLQQHVFNTDAHHV
ncbi:MAG: alpha/beta hydrolase fold domain-containing protein, partial [Myxococcota bacterium]